MATSDDEIWGFGTTQVLVPFGATLAVFVQGIGGQNSMLLKLYQGATLEIIGCPVANTFPFLGTTMSAGQLAAASGNHWIVGTNELISVDGLPAFYLSATGSSAIVCMIRGKRQGT